MFVELQAVSADVRSEFRKTPAPDSVPATRDLWSTSYRERTERTPQSLPTLRNSRCCACLRILPRPPGPTIGGSADWARHPRRGPPSRSPEDKGRSRGKRGARAHNHLHVGPSASTGALASLNSQIVPFKRGPPPDLSWPIRISCERSHRAGATMASRAWRRRRFSMRRSAAVGTRMAGCNTHTHANDLRCNPSHDVEARRRRLKPRWKRVSTPSDSVP